MAWAVWPPKCTWLPLPTSGKSHSYNIISRYHKIWKDTKDVISAKEVLRKEPVSGVIALKESMKYFDADFFDNSKLREMEDDAEEFNVPAFRENRKLVAMENGGLHNPSVLVFKSSWNGNNKVEQSKSFTYPRTSMVHLPSNDDDIAFMRIIELGELIRRKKITSQQLTDVFLRRLKRYSTVLNSVITYTEDLAYKQAKEADDLLDQGKYLGMVPFAIGSETAGSITYPAARCGVTALRPTFGTVARTGVMSISESPDKLGPFCRSAIDCAIILDLIRGMDAGDPSSREVALEDPFHVDITKLTVGYLDSAEMEVVDILSVKGVKLVPFKLNYTVASVQSILDITMDVDMLAHFDNWQREGHDDDYEAQDQWPVELRRARLVQAVDYIQAQRARGKLIREVRESFTVDAFIGNVTDWELVCLGNLVGMPVVVVPTGFKSIEGTRRRTTATTGIYARPDHDHIALALAMAYQSVTDHHKQRPPVDDLGPNDSIHK